MQSAVLEDYRTAFRGNFTSVLWWPKLDEFWDVLRADKDGGWYIYAIGMPPPGAPASGEEMERFIQEIDALLHKDHEEDYCGIVYADNLEAPGFIKIYDPNNLGVSCGFSDNPPLPGWVLSKMRPVDMQAPSLPGNRRRWWQRLVGR